MKARTIVSLIGLWFVALLVWGSAAIFILGQFYANVTACPPEQRDTPACAELGAQVESWIYVAIGAMTVLLIFVAMKLSYWLIRRDSD